MMKQTPPLALVLALSVASMACEKKADPGATVTSTGATVAIGSTAAAAAPARPKAAFVQKGVQPSKIVVGYMASTQDESLCAVVTDDPAKKEAFTKHAGDLANMFKAKVVASCPTENVVGTCNVGFGLLWNYSGPKWTAESAKKDCSSKPHNTWVE